MPLIQTTLARPPKGPEGFLGARPTIWEPLAYTHKCKQICQLKVTPVSRVPLEKLIVAHLVRKFPAFYGRRRLIFKFEQKFNKALFV
jgi:hypothetical protein